MELAKGVYVFAQRTDLSPLAPVSMARFTRLRHLSLYAAKASALSYLRPALPPSLRCGISLCQISQAECVANSRSWLH